MPPDALPWAAALLALTHAIASAAWLGAMLYSLLILQPRARAFFTTDQQFEVFLQAISSGARWKVLTAFALVGVTGAMLIPLTMPQPMTTTWLVFLLANALLFLVALALFCHISWRMWPSRVFATSAELPTIHRRFRLAGLTLTLLVAAGFILGVLSHRLR